MARSINESGSSWVFPDGPLEEIASRCDVITAASLVGSCKFYHDSATQSVALPASQPFGMPCVLHTHQTEVPPAHNPFSRVHKFKQEGAQKDKQHDAKDRKGTLCQLTPLDRISSDAVIPDGGTGMWAGANGDWIALLGFPWNWELVNVYTGRRIPLPPISEFKSTPDKLVFESNDQHLQLLKIAICRVPTAASNYTSFSVLAIFNAAIAVLHCASSRWTVLDNQFLALCRGGGDGHLEALTGDNIDLIAAHLDVTYTVRLAACSRELYDMISKDEGKMHHWDEPCLLMPPPAYWFDEHWDVARASRLHDTVYDLVPLDHPRRSVALPFMHDRKWLGANGDWIAAADHHEWCLVNVYTERHIPLPSLPDSKIHHSIVSYRPAYSFNWGPAIYLLKIVICQVPTKGGRYADYKLIALFDKTIFYLEGGGDWRMLEALTPAPDYPNYCDAIELRGHVFAVDETDGSTYFWDTANENLMLPFVIPPPVVDDQQYAWFLAPSADGKRLMIILTVNKIGIANAEVPPDIPYAANGLQLRQYPPVATYVFELDPLSTARAGDFLWRQVNSLSDHSLFLGLNYPIIANLKKRESKAPDGTLVPFMRKNCVYTAYRNIRYNQYPKILRCNLQPDEGETVGVISLPKDGWDSVRQAAMWFKPALNIARSVLPLKKQ
ncbi:hypothetical protein QYE76_062886 [Lolium multiflorum]|uniref:KIB1-4 beta-propeller domain-containing protein n=1 Tax=Lolium multiflorum TaxID=4521 RepID=A0AAD8S3I5_LOLMU|nr:hypothetical protein QYE76_062886 [Lolium multiflorum]